MTLKRLIGYFVRGCLVMAPLGLTVYILFTILRTIDQLLPIGIPGVGKGRKAALNWIRGVRGEL